MKEVVILDYLRIPSGKKNGRYSFVPPEEFTAFLLAEFFKRHPQLSHILDKILLATAVGTGGNMARYIALKAGFPVNVPAVTIDAQCVGSYEAINIGYAQIKAGLADLVIVGGFESNSLLPERKYHKNDPRNSTNSYLYADFAPDNFGENSLLKTAEQTATDFEVTKAEMGDWSILSNERAKATLKAGLLTNVILPFKGEHQDETLKEITVLQRFKSRVQLIDGATSCMFEDGAAILLLASKEGVEKMGVTPQFSIENVSSVGVEPSKTPIAFLEAIAKSNTDFKTQITDIDLFEINESFALKPLLLSRLHNIPAEKINVLGGNLAFGHPFGASGAINLIHLLVSLQQQNKELGLVAASAAGGIGSSIIVKRSN